MKARVTIMPKAGVLDPQGEAIRQAEVERARRMLARGDDPAAVLEALSGALTRKFLHGPTHALNHTQGEDREALLRLVPGLFRHSSHSER